MFKLINHVTLWIWCSMETRAFHAHNQKEEYLENVKWILANRRENMTKK